MQIAFNIYYDERVLYMINHILNSVPKQVIQYQEQGEYKYRFYPSTYPEYTRFLYTKKPKNWKTLEAKEKKKHRYYYSWNTKDILRTLRKCITRKKLLRIQANALEELFYEFNKYERMMIEVYYTDIFDKMYDIECKF